MFHHKLFHSILSAQEKIAEALTCLGLVQLSYLIKFIYSEKATKLCVIFTLLLSYVVPVKSKVKISQNCMAFSEYMNFNVIPEES